MRKTDKIEKENYVILFLFVFVNISFIRSKNLLIPYFFKK